MLSLLFPYLQHFRNNFLSRHSGPLKCGHINSYSKRNELLLKWYLYLGCTFFPSFALEDKGSLNREEILSICNKISLALVFHMVVDILKTSGFIPTVSIFWLVKKGSETEDGDERKKSWLAVFFFFHSSHESPVSLIQSLNLKYMPLRETSDCTYNWCFSQKDDFLGRKAFEGRILIELL